MYPIFRASAAPRYGTLDRPWAEFDSSAQVDPAISRSPPLLSDLGAESVRCLPAILPNSPPKGIENRLGHYSSTQVPRRAAWLVAILKQYSYRGDTLFEAHRSP